MSAVRCDAPDFSLCPAYRADWRWGEVDRCGEMDGFRAQAMRDLGVAGWTPDVDDAAWELWERWYDAAPRCADDAPARCVVVACALPSPASATAAAAERGR